MKKALLEITWGICGITDFHPRYLIGPDLHILQAYFAFRDLASWLNLFRYIEYWQSFDGPMINPKIEILYGNFRNNKRHYLQQSVYTLCTEKESGGVYFSNHEDAYLQPAKGGNDFLTKYILPSTERANALVSLEAYNINAHSLLVLKEFFRDCIYSLL